MQAALTKVSTGVNKKTWTPIYYVEARTNPRRPWCYVTDGKKWVIHRSRAAAEREARSLEKRLRAKMQ